MKHSNYWKLLLMLFVSFFVMYFVLFLNVDNSSHIYFSLARLYMSPLMVTPMSSNHEHDGQNVSQESMEYCFLQSEYRCFLHIIIATAQTNPCFRCQYMKAMIPHHSSAIMTSRNASIHDPGEKNYRKASSLLRSRKGSDEVYPEEDKQETRFNM